MKQLPPSSGALFSSSTRHMFEKKSQDFLIAAYVDAELEEV
jgi:hypothetical protein